MTKEHVCPHCGTDITRHVIDALRKVDASRFECPKCGRPLFAHATRIVTVE